MFRNVLRAAALSLSAAVLAACGGMSESSTPAAQSTAGAGCASTTKVRLVLQWVAQAQFAGYYQAQDAGYYAARCLDVTIQEGGTNVVPQQVLASGNAEFAVSHVTKTMASRAEGADLVNIGQVFQKGAYLQVAKKSTGITDLASLKGTRMGSWGGGNELVLFAALRDNGVEPTADVEVVQQPFDMSLLLKDDAASVQAKTYNEYAQLLETENPATGKLYTPNDFTVLDLGKLGYASLEDGVYARGDWLGQAGNADVAARFLAASYQGWIACRDNVDACVQTVLKHGSALGATHQKWMMNEVNKLIWPSPEGIGTMDQAAWDQTIANAMAGKVLKAKPTDGAFRTDINSAALDLLTKGGVDTIGTGYQPITVTLTKGGQ